jgi:8-oxo-dGTP pyrophosphatase MutT (NUDIX family)
MGGWRKVGGERVFHHRIFTLERQQLAREERRKEALVVRAPDWINVIPVLDDGQVVLIRQWRYGIGAPCLEIPGGLIDPGEQPVEAASRELEEETGYRAGQWRRLGSTHPNPAFLSNRLTTFLATDLERIGRERTAYGVDDEHITLEPTPLEEVPGLIRDGAITHALVIAAFHLLEVGREG